MKKQLTALMTAFALAAAAAPMPASSAEAPEGITFTYEKNEESVTITGFKGSDSVLIIPDTIEGLPVTEIGKNVFAGMSELTAVVIPDTVKSIGERSFSACPNLSSVTMGKSVTGMGGYAFSACPKLCSFTVSAENPTYLSKDGCLMSEKGNRLVLYVGGREAVIPDSVRVVTKGAFMGKTDITSVVIPPKATSLGDYTFSGCTSLKSVDIPDSVTNVGAGCFMSCSSLSSAKLGSGIKEIRTNVFNACTSLNDIIIPENTAAIGTDAFFGCTELNGIYIPETVTSIADSAIGQHYDLRNGQLENINGFILHGEEGSAAESYAAAAGIEFRPFLLGDVDDSGAVDGSDATMALREYSYCMDRPGSTLNIYGRLAADYDKSGAVDGSDATLILKEFGYNLANM
ncbi:MAG: leucine-rich repeat protein [Ruminococcus sp.]|nr:leucine-rich repeat protein [Ruminococcus sp.]